MSTMRRRDGERVRANRGAPDESSALRQSGSQEVVTADRLVLGLQCLRTLRRIFPMALKILKKRDGRIVDSRGYVLLWMPEHPLAHKNGYVYEHRLIAQLMIGRELKKGEIVHHFNENRGDNRPSNLVVCASIKEHVVKHRKRTDLRGLDEDNPVISCACGCGQQFKKYDEQDRPRKFLPDHQQRTRKKV